MKKIFCVVFMLFFIGCGDKTEIGEQNGSIAAPEITITENALEVKAENPLVSYDIDGNSRVNLGGEESLLTREIGAHAAIRNNYSKISKELLAKRLSKNYFLKCSSCHDDYANGVIGPSLLTKNADEIFDMIKAYKNSSEKNVLMEYLVSQMDDREIHSLADEIANFNAEIREKNNES